MSIPMLTSLYRGLMSMVRVQEMLQAHYMLFSVCRATVGHRRRAPPPYHSFLILVGEIYAFSYDINDQI
jgi:hypothetical protein